MARDDETTSTLATLDDSLVELIIRGVASTVVDDKDKAVSIKEESGTLYR